MKIKRIIYHWTAGTYRPNEYEKQAYHFLIDGNANIIVGKFMPEDNLDCTDGNYAKHTGGGNTGAIGIAFCGMLSYISPQNVGKYPLKLKQFEAGLKLGAEMINKYNMDVTQKETIQTHYGFGLRNPKTSSKGKIDLSFLPSYPDVAKEDIENYIRQKVKWYLQKIKQS